jgi:YggT family protein
MVNILSSIISILGNLIVLIVIVDSGISFFLSPYHPVRNVLDRFLQPLLAPIRRLVPLVGMFDLSPLILIILVGIIKYAMINFLFAL